MEYVVLKSQNSNNDKRPFSYLRKGLFLSNAISYPTGVSVGGNGVSVGGTGVFVGVTGVFVAVGGRGVLVG